MISFLNGPFELETQKVGAFGRELVKLEGQRVSMTDIDTSFDLLAPLMATDNQSKDAFKKTCASLLLANPHQLARPGFQEQWVRYETEKLHLLFRYTLRSIRRPGFTRSIALARLKEMVKPTDEISDMDMALPDCPPHDGVRCR